jgi:hypothetical protein
LFDAENGCKSMASFMIVVKLTPWTLLAKLEVLPTLFYDPYEGFRMYSDELRRWDILLSTPGEDL